MSGKYSILKFLVDERVHDYQANVKYHHLTRRNDEGQGKKGTSDGINIELAESRQHLAGASSYLVNE